MEGEGEILPLWVWSGVFKQYIKRFEHILFHLFCAEHTYRMNRVAFPTEKQFYRKNETDNKCWALSR